MSEELLFHKYQIYEVIQAQTESVKKDVQAIPANTLLNASENDLIQSLVEKHRLAVPTIDDEEIHVENADWYPNYFLGG